MHFNKFVYFYIQEENETSYDRRDESYHRQELKEMQQELKVTKKIITSYDITCDILFHIFQKWNTDSNSTFTYWLLKVSLHGAEYQKFPSELYKIQNAIFRICSNSATSS